MDQPIAPTLPGMAARLQQNSGAAIKIAFFGDSISEIGRTPDWFGGATAPEHHYSQTFFQLARQDWPHVDWEPQFLARGGHNTYEALGRFFQVAAFAPDLTVVALGANDLRFHPLTTEHSVFALQCILKEISFIKSDAVVVSASTPGPGNGWETGKARVDGQRELCRQRGIAFVDLYSELDRLMNQGLPWTTWYRGPDDCHPNDVGHALWGTQLWKMVKTIAEQTTAPPVMPE